MPIRMFLAANKTRMCAGASVCKESCSKCADWSYGQACGCVFERTVWLRTKSNLKQAYPHLGQRSATRTPGPGKGCTARLHEQPRRAWQDSLQIVPRAGR
eukprot:199739-Pleurochrysis_carterae.AAC.2